jgi:pimeloyl-ACP methyl ester carboxylesterase
MVAAHSYGGQVITALGLDAPNVVGLVYVAGFGLDEGESIGGFLGHSPPTPAIASLQVDEQGFAWLPEDAFLQHFAPDVDPIEARVMCAVQQPLAFSTLNDDGDAGVEGLADVVRRRRARSKAALGRGSIASLPRPVSHL